jgi:hypothetical protein
MEGDIRAPTEVLDQPPWRDKRLMTGEPGPYWGAAEGLFWALCSAGMAGGSADSLLL